MIRTVVPDASVLLKWAFNDFDEADREKAMDFLNVWLDGRVNITLPKLWSFEVGNVLMIKNPGFAVETMEIFLGYSFDEFDMTFELCKEIFKLMKNYEVTFYDAAYHAVAILNGGVLLTADEAYCKKVGDTASVMRLKDWS